MVNMTSTLRSPGSSYNPTSTQLQITGNNRVYYTRDIGDNNIDSITQQSHGKWYYQTRQQVINNNNNDNNGIAHKSNLTPYEKQLIQLQAQKDRDIKSQHANQHNDENRMLTEINTSNKQYGIHTKFNNNNNNNADYRTHSLKNDLWPDYNKTKQNLGYTLGNTASNDTTYRVQCNDLKTYPNAVSNISKNSNTIKM